MGLPPPPRAFMFRLLFNQRTTQAIQGYRYQHDSNTDLERLSDAQRLQAHEQIMTKTFGADKRGDNHHRQTLHNYLINANHQGGVGGGQLDLKQHLARCASSHNAGFDDLLRDSA